MEFLDGVDLVAEELDADGVGQRRRKHVDDASAHREFAAVHDQVDARVRVLHQPSRRLVQRKLPALGEHQGLDVAQARDHGLDQRTHRHDEDANRSEQRAARLRMPQSAEHRHAARHGVGAGRKPLMGQCLPRLQLRHLIGVAGIPGAYRLDGFLGLASGSHDEHDGTAAGDARGERGAQSFRHAYRDGGVNGAFRLLDISGDQFAEIIVGLQHVEDAGQRARRGEPYGFSGH